MPSSIEKLQKFFKLEAERGYDNRAVVGGLDKILPAWENEAKTTGIPDNIIQLVDEKIREYPSLPPQDRSDILDLILTAIRNLEVASINPGDLPEAAQPISLDSNPHGGPAQNYKNPEIDSRPRNTGARKNAKEIYNAAGSNAGLLADLTILPGIGPKTAQTMSSLGLKTLEDLLYYFPRRYDDYSQLKPINRLQYGEEISVIGTVQNIHSRPIRGGKFSMLEAIISDGTGSLRVTWFNQPWLEKSIRSGDQLVLSGKVDLYLGRISLTNPDWETIDQEHLHTSRIVPVYSLTARVTQKNLRRLMHQTVNFWAPRIKDYLTESIRAEGKLMPLPDALLQIHFPENQDSLRQAQDRLAFDEIFLLQLGVLSQKKAWQSYTAQVFGVADDWLNGLISKLPYPLTNAQLRAVGDIQKDLQSGRPMNRLLQGDVGSGKTIVAALAAAIIRENDAQTAIMAPTSILAEQHYRNLSQLFTETLDSPFNPGEIRLLVGDTSEVEKQDIREGLAAGTIKLVIGTHALIESPVEFKRLQLTVIDEQHRFGVEQRAALRVKGENPHLLVMTATPIPRSLALTLYGDLDLSVMDEMPAGRQPIETHLMLPLERERAYSFIRSQIAKGNQAFIIYPLVEKGEEGSPLAAVDESERLQKEVFKDLKVGLVHGRMRPEEKEKSMSDFRAGKYQILVSTSVIEVGVDVPNATVMLIEGANRFGLSQLHQFRGRVGRGQDQSYCILIPDHEDAAENARLNAMLETSDGFILAEKDLEQRGPGDFLGTRQAGFADLKLANLTNIRMIEKARNLAQNLFEKDPDLSQNSHFLLKETLERFWTKSRGDIS